MIRIERSSEPPALRDVREARLPLARRAKEEDAASATVFSSEGYGMVKPQLADMQHRKCCYCEKRQEQEKYRDVEHYRPKGRYWWLTWTWENLLFACIDCNREHKRNQFPLSPGDVALEPEEPPPGRETPLVIDPADTAVDPTNEIEFLRVKIAGVEYWRPQGLSPRGRKTVEVCALARPALLDLYRRHVNQVVRPRVHPVITAHHVSDPRAVLKAWGQATRALLHQEAEFRALSYDALRVLVPEKVRTLYHLEIERPRSRLE